MRIITGSARGVRLDTLPGESTRPTSERAKEAIFSMLQFGLEGRRVLDLFAGSGQMALEALSRGAEFAVMVDAGKSALEVIKRNAQRTRLEQRARLVCSDAMRYLEGCSEQPFHLVFLDPPYAAGLIPQSLKLLLARKLLTPGAIVVCESFSAADVWDDNEDLKSRFEILKATRYGVAHVTILTPKKETIG